MVNPRYLRVEDFMKDATPTDVFDEIRKDIEKEYDRPISTSERYRMAGIDAEAWSELADKPL